MIIAVTMAAVDLDIAASVDWWGQKPKGSEPTRESGEQVVSNICWEGQ